LERSQTQTEQPPALNDDEQMFPSSSAFDEWHSYPHVAARPDLDSLTAKPFFGYDALVILKKLFAPDLRFSDCIVARKIQFFSVNLL